MSGGIFKNIVGLAGMAERRKVGNYELLEKIGAGGMGAVFKARQVAMDRIVALKILPPSLAKKPTFIERFLREARASAKLNHPNIVNGIDVGNDAGLYYFAMEYIEGASLKKIIERDERLTEKRTIEISAAIAHALEHAHSHGILHRDIKPDNIIVDTAGTAKLCDLGLAHLAAEPDMETGPDKKRTAVGTPHYISPEQARGEEDLDATTDLYSLGATMYHMLTGVTLYQGTTSAKIMAKHLTEKPPNPNEFEITVSKGMLSVLAKLLTKNRADRYTSAAKLAQDLERIAGGHGPQYAGISAEKWPFKTGGPSAEQPSIKKVITVQVDVRPPKRIRSSGDVSPLGAYALGGVVLIGLLLLLASGATSDNSSQMEHRSKTPPITETIPPIQNEAPSFAPAPPPEKQVAQKTPEKPAPAPNKANIDPIGLADAGTSPPSSLLTGNVDTDPAPEIHPVVARARVPMHSLLIEARLAMESGKFAAVQAAVASMRSDYANTDDLREVHKEVDDLDIRSKTAMATSAVIDDGNVALFSNGATVQGPQQFLSLNDGKLECTKFAGYAFQANPCEWKVTLPKTYLLREIRLLLYDLDDTRYYQYAIEVSADGQTFTTVDDKSTSQAKSWQFTAFAPTPVKQIKLKGKFNSQGPNFQVVELEAYCHPNDRPASPRPHAPEPQPQPVAVTPPATPPAPATPAIPVAVAEVKPAAENKDKKVVDLIKLFDSKNFVSANWDLEDGLLTNRSTKGKNGGKAKGNGNGNGYGTGQSSTMLDFPYVPPEEYDYTVEFSIEDPAPTSLGLILQSVPINLRSLVWVMPAAPDPFFGFDMIQGLRYTESANPTHLNIPKGVSISTKHKSTLQVRRVSVTVVLDDVKIMVWRRDGISPSKDSQYKGKDATALGVGAGNKVNLKVYSAEVVEITGSGSEKK